VLSQGPARDKNLPRRRKKDRSALDRVVLPAPFGPSNAVNCPGDSAKTLFQRSALAESFDEIANFQHSVVRRCDLLRLRAHSLLALGWDRSSYLHEPRLSAPVAATVAWRGWLTLTATGGYSCRKPVISGLDLRVVPSAALVTDRWRRKPGSVRRCCYRTRNRCTKIKRPGQTGPFGCERRMRYFSLDFLCTRRLARHRSYFMNASLSRRRALVLGRRVEVTPCRRSTRA